MQTIKMKLYQTLISPMKPYISSKKHRKKEDGSYQGTTWQIKFNLDDTEASKIYKLRLALASANVSELQVQNLIKNLYFLNNLLSCFHFFVSSHDVLDWIFRLE